ncbi:MAG: hypothetical protein ACOY0T_37850 [Myxococcota bacterium]
MLREVASKKHSVNAFAEDTVRNAAALWVSAGKTQGFAEGMRAACNGFEQVVSQWESLTSSEVAGKVKALCEQFRKRAEEEIQSSVILNEAALAMVTRLEHKRSVRSRLIAAFYTFRDG